MVLLQVDTEVFVRVYNEWGREQSLTFGIYKILLFSYFHRKMKCNFKSEKITRYVIIIAGKTSH